MKTFVLGLVIAVVLAGGTAFALWRTNITVPEATDTHFVHVA